MTDTQLILNTLNKDSLSIEQLSKILNIQEKTIKFLVKDLYYLGLLDKNELGYTVKNKK